jgi:hypothetical protein
VAFLVVRLEVAEACHHVADSLAVGAGHVTAV